MGQTHLVRDPVLIDSNRSASFRISFISSHLILSFLHPDLFAFGLTLFNYSAFIISPPDHPAFSSITNVQQWKEAMLFERLMIDAVPNLRVSLIPCDSLIIIID